MRKRICYYMTQPLPQEVLLLAWRIVNGLVKELPNRFSPSRDQSSYQLHLGAAAATQRRNDVVLKENVAVPRQTRNAIIAHHECGYEGCNELAKPGR